GASPQNRSRAKRHRIITIELGPAGVRVALLPDGSESGLLHDPIDRRVVRHGDERRRRSKANDGLAVPGTMLKHSPTTARRLGAPALFAWDSVRELGGKRRPAQPPGPRP